MRCINRNCNHILSDFETTRKDRNNAYLDLCVYCCPYDPVEHRVNPRHPYVKREAYNENEGGYDDFYDYDSDEDEE